jgi:hypothetical protein
MTERPPELEAEALGRLLAALPPVPDALVEAAALLPEARREADRIVALAEADEQFRAAVEADLEAALEAAGYPPSRALLGVLRERLGR